MSDWAYFEYATLLRPTGNQLDGTPANYLVEVSIKDPDTGEVRPESDLKKLANDFLNAALGQEVQEIVEFQAISESQAQKLRKLHSAGSRASGAVYLVEEAEK